MRAYEPALAVQLFYGTIIHQVLDRAHNHYRGLIGPQKPKSLPTDDDIEKYFEEVEKSLKARRIRAVAQVRDAALKILKQFNQLEGPTLYPRVLDTECKLQADQSNYILHGNVDVLAEAEGIPGEVELWDYKGARKPSISSPQYQRYEFQMQVYAELYRRRTGKMPRRGVIYFLNELSVGDPIGRPIDALLEVDLSRPNVIQAMQNFDDTVTEIEQCRSKREWPAPHKPPEQKTCEACDLRWNCSAARSFGFSFNMTYP